MSGLENKIIPETQYAVMLTGPDCLELNEAKPVIMPTGNQILCRVEATGLCFSDLKLLKQFNMHGRKTEVIKGIDGPYLNRIPSYAPGEKPTVPGHETVVRIVAIGESVKNHKIGDRCLVQTDYRKLITAGGSNAAFGYNFEGGLQEYVIIDEKISVDMDSGEPLLLSVSEQRSASSICLVEPWACVEDSYANMERRTIKPEGNLLIVIDKGFKVCGIENCFHKDGFPANVCILNFAGNYAIEPVTGHNASRFTSADSLPDILFDDIIYFGVNPQHIQNLSKRLNHQGIFSIIRCGKMIGTSVSVPIGNIHYGMTRWVGTPTNQPADAYKMIPENGEIRDDERILIVGAGGPMGQMHAIRNICSGKKSLVITATDFDDVRLDSLRMKTEVISRNNGVELRTLNPEKEKIRYGYTYIVLMAPVPTLVSQAIELSDKESMINIFAGIPASTIHELDLDAIIDKRCFMFGTSGSVLADMKTVLGKIESGNLDTDISVDAVSGVRGVIEGIRAVEKRTLAGKIIVYPELHDMGLIPLSEIHERYPSVAEAMSGGRWTLNAEKELLRVSR